MVAKSEYNQQIQEQKIPITKYLSISIFENFADKVQKFYTPILPR